MQAEQETSTIDPAERNARLDGPVSDWFELTYSTHLVLPRTLMQSMSLDWQRRMVACLKEFDRAFEHLDLPEYEVIAAAQRTYGDLTKAEMRMLDVTQGEPAYDGDDSWPDRYYDRYGTEHSKHDRVFVPLPGGDPIPHYNRNRTFVEPR
ncbi:hypothetical protein I0C86_40735 [Plantactinospora sp. S1510]|uniref:Uncharacterized protein n=1 Tax=Plantactinospora alkalitolerans TaxID=2789879 RepID=A0ABS0H9Q7_9ACTN|nr:hypothetical protein [Plantactinospora alkalitolerans]MBF9135208.1 hypothetical protein [Plantactinospora alkalitolerans]